jgi:Icc-related predicted phosphoesterase
MKIVCISDTHGQHRQLVMPRGDILIHAGDMTVKGTILQINDCLDWLASLPYKHKIVIAGNHDFGFEVSPNLIQIPNSVTYLQHNVVELYGLKFWGSPVCPPYHDWAFMWSLERRKKLYETIPEDVDVIINHSPPFGILDYAILGCHAGCEALRDRLTNLRPKLCVFGHIHENYGMQKIDDIIYVNAAILNKQYEIANKPIVIDLDIYSPVENTM